MPVIKVNGASGIKYQDTVTPIELRLNNANGTRYELEGKTIKARFSNNYGYLLEKDVTGSVNQSGDLLIKISKEDTEKIGLGRIYLEIVVSGNDGDKIFPEDNMIQFVVYKNAKNIGQNISGVSFDFFVDKFNRFSEDVLAVAEASLDLHDETIQNAQNAIDIAERTQSEMNQVLANKDDSPLAQQMKVGGKGTTYSTPQARLLAEMNTKYINYLGDYAKKAADLPSSYPVGVSAVHVRGDDGWFTFGTVTTIRGFERNGGGVFQIYSPYGGQWGGIEIKFRNGIFNGNDEAYWGDWQTFATTAKAQMSKVTADDGWAILISAGTDLNTVFKGGFYRGNNLVNRPADADSTWGFVEVIQQGATESMQRYTSFANRRTFVRQSNYQGTWSDWVRVDAPAAIDFAKSYGLGTYAVPFADDVNNYKTTGFYRFDRTSTNTVNGPPKQPDEHNWVMMMVIQHSPTYTVQFAWDLNGNRHYIRRYNASNWGAWQEQGIQAIKDVGIAVSSTKTIQDLNDITISGFYDYNSTTLNIPATNMGGGVVQYIPTADVAGYQGTMLAFSDNKRVGWMRRKSNGTWSDWLQIFGSTDDAKWMPLTPRGGTTIYNDTTPLEVIRHGDAVEVRGVVKGITGADTIVATLPGLYRPGKDHNYANPTSVKSGNATFARWSIDPTTGDIKMERNSSGIYSADDWYPIRTMFFITK